MDGFMRDSRLEIFDTKEYQKFFQKHNNIINNKTALLTNIYILTAFKLWLHYLVTYVSIYIWKNF